MWIAGGHPSGDYLSRAHALIYSLTSWLLAKSRTEGGEVDVSNVSGRLWGLGIHQGVAKNTRCLPEELWCMAWNVQSKEITPLPITISPGDE